MRIDACYDSHVHWAATGEFAQRLRLEHLQSPSELLQMRPDPYHFRGEWLVGFGWDDNAWTEKPTLALMDQWMPDKPVALSRCDGHAVWVNSAALKRVDESALSVTGGRFDRSAGLLIDKAMDAIEKLIPAPSGFELRRHMLQAMKTFNDAGFTHIRDMTCDEAQWNEAVKLDNSGLLTMAVEEYFWLKSADALDGVLQTLKKARDTQTNCLRVLGIKLFLDGALGSEGALLSRCYHGRAHAGLKLWQEAELREVITRTWAAGFAVAAHAIGDEAADLIVRLVVELNEQGKTGALHIEHAELIRPDTIALMQGKKIECHLQPAHWLGDRRWLEAKIGDLMVNAFPWRRLQEAEIPFDFGSDSPIEPPSIGRTFQALRESAEAGIPRLLGLPSTYMSHRDLAWVPNSFTLLEEEAPVQVVFRGEHLM